jgi:hypothetical protein
MTATGRAQKRHSQCMGLLRHLHAGYTVRDGVVRSLYAPMVEAVMWAVACTSSMGGASRPWQHHHLFEARQSLLIRTRCTNGSAVMIAGSASYIVKTQISAVALLKPQSTHAACNIASCMRVPYSDFMVPSTASYAVSPAFPDAPMQYESQAPPPLTSHGYSCQAGKVLSPRCSQRLPSRQGSRSRCNGNANLASCSYASTAGLEAAATACEAAASSGVHASGLVRRRTRWRCCKRALDDLSDEAAHHPPAGGDVQQHLRHRRHARARQAVQPAPWDMRGTTMLPGTWMRS